MINSVEKETSTTEITDSDHILVVENLQASYERIIALRDISFHINLGEARAMSDPTRHFAYAVGSDHYMYDSLTIQAMGARGTGSFVADMADPRLRASAPTPRIVVRLSAHDELP